MKKKMRKKNEAKKKHKPQASNDSGNCIIILLFKLNWQ